MDTTVEGHEFIEEAWSQHGAGLVRRLRAVTRDEAVAQDLAQEAFLRLTREVQEGRPPEKVGAWLHRVGMNLAMSRGRHGQVADHWAPVVAARERDRQVIASPEDLAIERERDGALADALSGMRSVDREALLMAANGYRGAEIADRLGRTELATRTLLCRARTRLRGRLLAAGIEA